MQRGKLEKRTKALADKALAYLKEKKGATSNTEIRVKAFCDSFAPFLHTDTCTEEVKLEILETLKKYRNEADPDPLTDDLAYAELLQMIDTAIALVENECFDDLEAYMRRLGECFKMYSTQEAENDKKQSK